jgi:hypothetical protein
MRDGPRTPHDSARTFLADNKYRGERFRSAFLSHFRRFCGHFAVTQTVQTRSARLVRHHSALRLSARTNSEPGATPSAWARRMISA